MKYLVFAVTLFFIACNQVSCQHTQSPYKSINEGVKESHFKLKAAALNIISTIDTTNRKQLHADCLLIAQKADSLDQYIENIKTMLVVTADGDSSAIETRQVVFEKVKNKSDYETPTRLMLDEQGGHKLKSEMNRFRKHCVLVFGNDAAKQKFSINVLDVAEEDGPEIEMWEVKIFEHTPLAAAITHLEKLQADVWSDAGDAIGHLVIKAIK